ncbi:hypothetical protein R3P38DRAFT_3211810 [Favolaschia claudopus]|uniref:Uncharacterized protein n=1 Tax=Favolaschia claudopus TaxID=2862362 RepID=A0AAW0AHJ9_9AGAR
MPPASSNPAHYNADDRLRWEAYAANTHKWGIGRGPHPGPSPPGYRKVYKLGQRHAPVPEEYPDPATRHVGHGNTAMAAVNMSEYAFVRILENQQDFVKTVLDKVQTKPAPTYHRGPRDRFNRKGNGIGEIGKLRDEHPDFETTFKHTIVSKKTDRVALTRMAGNKNQRRDDGFASDQADAGGSMDVDVVTEGVGNVDLGADNGNAADETYEEGQYVPEEDNGFNTAVIV